MPLNRSSLFLEVIEGFSKNPGIGDGNVEGMAKEILHKSSHFLKVERANIWLTNENEPNVHCLLAYQKKVDLFYFESPLVKAKCPIYCGHIGKNEFIISSDSRKEPFMEELLNEYLIPNDIYSMIEVPIIMGGKLRGIMCFENTAVKRDWSNDEQHFAIALAHLMTLTLENEEKNRYREELEKVVKEKSLLINEMNHRVKNNLTIINALIKSESNKAKDEFHKELFLNLKSKTFTLSSLIDFTIESNGENEVDLKAFISKLFKNIKETYGYELNVIAEIDLREVKIEEKKAMPTALILNEIIVNCYKHAFNKMKSNEIHISLNKAENNSILIKIADNGKGLPENYNQKGLGFDFIYGLCDQIDSKISIDTSALGTTIEIEITQI
jgi:two-component sensor histidine kinase